MSGGYLNYQPYEIAGALYPGLNLDYGDDGYSQTTKAGKINPFGDIEISEMCWDMLCLLKALEWKNSGDIGVDTYEACLKDFAVRWCGIRARMDVNIYKDLLREYADELCEEIERRSK